MSSSRVFLSSCSLFLVTLVLIPGCGGGPAKSSLSGTVTYGDKLVKTGQVMIYGGDGAVKVGDINPDGTYLVKDVVAGNVTICVASPSPTADARGGDPKRGAPNEAPKVNAKDWFAISLDYIDPAKSGLKLNLTAGEQKHDIKMTKK